MFEKWKSKPVDTDDEYLTPTYASRSMRTPVHKFIMPENSLPSDVVYELIHEQLQLDAKPSLNLASFVTTWMEPQAQVLIKENLKINLVDKDEYPQVLKFEKRCVNMLGRLFHAEKESNHHVGVGTATIGSSEAVMLAGLALKWNWRKKRQAKNLPADKPNIVMGSNVQVVWEKFARYFDVEPKYIPLTPGRYTINAEEVVQTVDENTIGVCVTFGTTFTGEYEPVAEINDALAKKNVAMGWDIPIHVDAASGGFVAPFLTPEIKWDFRLPLVVSINVSGHKYGLVYPGVGWIIWRNSSYLPEELIFHVNYLGGNMPSFNLNFSRPAAFVIGQYYNFLRLGKEGYRHIMHNLRVVADHLYDKLAAFSQFELVSNKVSLPVVAWRIKSDVKFSAFDLSYKMREFGWSIPAYTMPKNVEDVAMLRIVVREHLSLNLAQELVHDIKSAVNALESGYVAPPNVNSQSGKITKPC